MTHSPSNGISNQAVSNKGIALVTGASSGIGAIYADRLAKRGYDLILVARDEARLAGVADRITAATESRVEILAADLTLKSDLKRIEERLRSDTSLTALVNNAGFGATAKLVESDVDEMESMIQLNVTALTRLSLAVLPGLIARKNGTIINISSIAAVAPELLNGVYGGTKAYVVALTQSLAQETKATGVQVQAVLPGAISTEFWDRAGLPFSNFPPEIVMQAEELVDSALVGFDQHELITIPSLPNAADWDVLDAARLSLGPNLSHIHAAPRYH